MITWFTSDQHFGHKNIVAYSGRPFADSHEMDETLVHRHNAVVREDDVVWHLGDFSLDEKITKRTLPLLKGRHYLVAGNHDACHACHKRHVAATRRYLSYGFQAVEQAVIWQSGALSVHMPPIERPAPDEALPDVRYAEHRMFLDQVPHGVVLHGHVHEKWKVRRVGEILMVNVGVDQWDYRPIAWEELAALIEQHRAASAAP